MASAAFSFFFFLVTKKTFLEVQRRQGRPGMPTSGLSSIDSGGTLVAGSPPSSSSSRQCRDISNFPGAQGSLSSVDSNTLMIKKGAKRTRSWNWKWLQNQIKFSRPFYRASRAFCCDQNVHVALVTPGARRSTRNLPYVTITHSYVLAFFATSFLLLFRSHFCRNCSFPPPISTWFGFRAFSPLWPVYPRQSNPRRS